jgi:hypothetical protein
MDTPFSGIFARGVVYKAIVALTANTGFTFVDFNGNFEHARADEIIQSYNAAAGVMTITITFMQARDPIIVTGPTDLRSAFSAPAAGSAPLEKFDQHQFSGIINWRTAANIPFNGTVFAANTVYRAVVNLEAASGFFFEGFTGTFTYTGAIVNSAVYNETEKVMVVTITFPATASTVNVFNLSSRITAPVQGAAPAASLSGAGQYTGTITWRTMDGIPVTGQFTVGVVYNAVVTLTTQTGFTFHGVPANSFNYTPAARYEITNPANSGVVNIIFKPVAFRHLMRENHGLRVFTCCFNVDPNRSKNFLIDGNTGVGNFWAYCSTDTPAGDYIQVLMDMADGSIDGNTGHKQALASLSLPPAHFITYDLAVIREIAGLAYFPTNNNSSLGRNNALLRYEVFISDTVDIGIDPRVTGVTSLGTGTFESVNPSIDQGSRYLHWQSIDMTRMNNGNPVTARYVQLRIYSTTGRTSSDEQVDLIEASAAELTIALNVAPETLPPAVISRALDFTNFIPQPITGIQPIRTFPIQDQYSSGTITWSPVIPLSPVTSNIFLGATSYTATFTLNPMPGFTFTGFAGSLIHEGAVQNGITFTHSGDSINVSIQFITTSAIYIISNHDLTSLVPIPEAGRPPQTTVIDDEQYSGTITWQTMEGITVTGQFAAGVNYRAVVTLNAKEGFTFTNVPANSFTHANASSVTNAANSGTVTLVFRTTPIYLTLPETAIKGCCWVHPNTPSLLINGNAVWDNEWRYGFNNDGFGSDFGLVHGSWSNNVPGGWSSAAHGHYNELRGTDALAHFFSFDLGEEKNIIAFDFFPAGLNATTPNKPFGEGEIWISDSPINIRPQIEDGAVRVAVFVHLVNQIRWYENDITAQNDGNPVTARYVQIRFTELSPRDTSSQRWRDGRLAQLRIGVTE